MTDQATAQQPPAPARLLIEAAEKILDMQRGEGYTVAHPNAVENFLFDVAMDLQARQIDTLAESLGMGG